MSSVSELARPAGVERANRAMELARVWLVDKHQEIVLSGNLWEDPAAWGLLLVDMARQVANAYQAQGRDRADVLARIREGLDAEWDSPTDDAAPIKGS